MARVNWGVIILGCGLLLAVGYLIFSDELNPEPRYQGKTLSHWFGIYCDEYTTPVARSKRALSAISTKATPFLLKKAFSLEADPPLRRLYISAVQNMPYSWRSRFPSSIPSEKAQEAACMALLAIRPQAAPVLPLLQEKLQSPHLTTRRQAAFLLGTLGLGGEAAVPLLVPLLQDKDSITRGLALQSLEFLGSNSAAAVPALLDYASKETNRIPLAAVFGAIGPSAKPAFDTITEWLKGEADARKRVDLASALCQIDPQAEAGKVIIEALRQKKDNGLREAAAYTAKYVSASMPDLLQAFSETDPLIWSAAFHSLKDLHCDDKIINGVLANKMQSQDPNERLNAASVLLRTDPHNSEAATYLRNIAADRLDPLREIAKTTLQDVTVDTGYPASVKEKGR